MFSDLSPHIQLIMIREFIILFQYKYKIKTPTLFAVPIFANRAYTLQTMGVFILKEHIELQAITPSQTLHIRCSACRKVCFGSFPAVPIGTMVGGKWVYINA